MPITGQRIVFPGKGGVAVEPFDVSDAGPHQVLVRTERTAVSAGTELTSLLGANPVSHMYPMYPG
jgi:hypothetical protein